MDLRSTMSVCLLRGFRAHCSLPCNWSSDSTSMGDFGLDFNSVLCLSDLHLACAARSHLCHHAPGNFCERIQLQGGPIDDDATLRRPLPSNGTAFFCARFHFTTRRMALGNRAPCQFDAAHSAAVSTARLSVICECGSGIQLVGGGAYVYSLPTLLPARTVLSVRARQEFPRRFHGT